MPAVTRLPVGDATQYFQDLTLKGQRQQIADKILKEIRERLQFLVNVGLDYLTLDRSADTLSGGEAQRIRLASQTSPTNPPSACTSATTSGCWAP